MRKIPDKKRFEVLKRDNFTCQYCGRKPPEVSLCVDHITPVSLGGSDDDGNLITACERCNSGKGNININAPAPENRDRTVHVRLTLSLYEELKNYAQSLDSSINEIVFRAVEKEIGGENNGGKKNSKHSILDRWKGR